MSRRFVPAGLRQLRWRVRALDELARLRQLDRLDQIAESLGRIEARQLEDLRGTLAQHEFRVFSHAGEDGIIQLLVHSVSIPKASFVEFGVEDYREANTRFLLVKDHWSGLVMDGDVANIDRIRDDQVYRNEDLQVRVAFVTRENVNGLLADAGMTGDIGLLSVDVDGNDYWIFDAIDVVRPAVAVVEYNHRFGPTRSVTIPYDPHFVRRQTDASWLVCGASLAALVGAAARKGMSFVGCNSFGNNAFFVRTDLKPDWLPSLTAVEGFVAGKFREALLIGGEEVVPSPEEERRLVADAALQEVP